MKLALTINGRDRHIELLGGSFRLDEGQEKAFDVEMVTPGVYSILLDGLAYDALVEETPEGLAVTIDGHRFETVVRDPRRYTRKSTGEGGEGMQKVVSPMPGKVVRVLVAVGDAVDAGQGLLVVEAMKMQNEMKTPRAGRVVSLTAKEGATVTAGEVLATIE